MKIIESANELVIKDNTIKGLFFGALFFLLGVALIASDILLADFQLTFFLYVVIIVVMLVSLLFILGATKITVTIKKDDQVIVKNNPILFGKTEETTTLMSDLGAILFTRSNNVDREDPDPTVYIDLLKKDNTMVHLYILGDEKKYDHIPQRIAQFTGLKIIEDQLREVTEERIKEDELLAQMGVKPNTYLSAEDRDRMLGKSIPPTKDKPENQTHDASLASQAYKSPTNTPSYSLDDLKKKS